MQRETVLFNGIPFIRYPESSVRSHRVYFTAYPGGKRAKGIGLLHQEVWKAAHGPIPDGCDIHHRDGDPLNNAVDNLECLTKKEHAQRHAPEHREARQAHMRAIGPAAAEWHRSEAGRAWHREHGRRTWEDREPVERTCAECGGAHLALRQSGARPAFCSRRCISRYHERHQTYYEDRPCVVCGEPFRVKKSHAQRTCSRKCAWGLRRLT